MSDNNPMERKESEEREMLHHLIRLEKNLEDLKLLFLYGVGALFTGISATVHGLHGALGIFRILFFIYCLCWIWKYSRNGRN